MRSSYHLLLLVSILQAGTFQSSSQTIWVDIKLDWRRFREVCGWRGLSCWGRIVGYLCVQSLRLRWVVGVWGGDGRWWRGSTVGGWGRLVRGEQRSEIGPSRNVPPFSNSIALDPFHILNKIWEQNWELKTDRRFTKDSLTNIFKWTIVFRPATIHFLVFLLIQNTS